MWVYETWLGFRNISGYLVCFRYKRGDEGDRVRRDRVWQIDVFFLCISYKFVRVCEYLFLVTDEISFIFCKFVLVLVILGLGFFLSSVVVFYFFSYLRDFFLAFGVVFGLYIFFSVVQKDKKVDSRMCTGAIFFFLRID